MLLLLKSWINTWYEAEEVRPPYSSHKHIHKTWKSDNLKILSNQPTVRNKLLDVTNCKYKLPLTKPKKEEPAGQTGVRRKQAPTRDFRC